MSFFWIPLELHSFRVKWSSFILQHFCFGFEFLHFSLNCQFFSLKIWLLMKVFSQSFIYWELDYLLLSISPFGHELSYLPFGFWAKMMIFPFNHVYLRICLKSSIKFLLKFISLFLALFYYSENCIHVKKHPYQE